VIYTFDGGRSGARAIAQCSLSLALSISLLIARLRWMLGYEETYIVVCSTTTIYYEVWGHIVVYTTTNIAALILDMSASLGTRQQVTELQELCHLCHLRDSGTKISDFRY
jgi:hypothetical protein